MSKSTTSRHRFPMAEKPSQGVSAETDLARGQQEPAEARARYRAARELKSKH